MVLNDSALAHAPSKNITINAMGHPPLPPMPLAKKAKPNGKDALTLALARIASIQEGRSTLYPKAIEKAFPKGDTRGFTAAERIKI